ncbi:MAG: glycosyltransferase [Ignavibacterium album]|uniref:glycosyltransferase n=1 Tax=Ignavibacterium album TaxID=591197 RepID=UPI0026F16510|nr:glycosyltransferase [Ignavibacterium album]MCX8105120.1 glycosyltransferase [Ignavibacterium album]
MTDLSIIIVNYNVKEYLKNLLHSIKKASQNLSTEIFVVDNASDDGSVEMIREKFPEVKLIANEKNLGFGKANNLALKEANGKFLLLINPDTLVAEDTFSKLIEFFESHPDAGMVGCKILNPDGTLQLACRRSFPGPWTSFTKVTGLSSLFPKSKLFARYNLTYLDENQTYEVDAISGSFMMMRKEVYDKVGGFDEQFFMYGEDLDLCYRIQKAGYKIYYVHSTQIIHYKGESTKRSSLDETKVFYDAMHLFVKKHLSGSFIVELILRSAIAVRSLFAFLGKKKLIIISVILDFIFFNLCIYVAQEIYVKIKPSWLGFPEYAEWIVYTVPAFLQIMVASFAGAYQKSKLSILKVLISLAISFPILTSLTFFFKQFAFSRAVILIAYILAIFVFVFWRIIFKQFFHKNLISDTDKQKRTLIVGTQKNAIQIASKLKQKKTEIRNIVGLISNSYKEVGNKIDSFEVIGTDQNINKIIRDYKVDEVIFLSDELSYNQMIQIISSLRKENVEFKVVGSDQDFVVGKTSVSILDDMPLFEISFNISDTKMRFIKSLFDFSLALITLFLVYPFIFFKHKIASQTKTDFSEFILSVPSVLTGKFSFVGPKKDYDSQNIFLGKKGLTGFWYYETDDEDEIEKLDFYYAKNQNIWMDIEIISKSLNKMLNKKN